MTADLTTPDGTPVSGFCFGAMQFGGKADQAASAAMFDAARGAGINFFDTAHVYNGGRSERILGDLARTQREALFIATKCASDVPSDAASIRRQFDKSRERLGIDSVDLLYLHRWHGDVPLEETFGTLAELVDTGQLRHVGVSNFSAWQTMKAERVARSFGIRVAVLQPMYNLVKRQAEVEILPMAASEGFAVCPYSPLGGGLLTGKYAAGESGRLTEDKMYAGRYRQEWMFETAAALARLAAEEGVHPATLAVAWVARNPAVTAPIISARSAAQDLAPSLAAIGFDMGDALYDRISALSPRPAPATDRSEET